MVEDLKSRTHSLAVDVIRNNDRLSASDKEMTTKSAMLDITTKNT